MSQPVSKRPGVSKKKNEESLIRDIAKLQGELLNKFKAATAHVTFAYEDDQKQAIAEQGHTRNSDHRIGLNFEE